DHDRHDDRFFDERMAQRIDGFADEPRAIVGRDDLHAWRHRMLDFLEFRLDPVNHVERVLAKAHDDDAADHFALAIELRDTTPNVWAEPHLGHVADADWGTARIGAERDAFDIGHGLEIAAASNHVFATGKFEQSAFDV